MYALGSLNTEKDAVRLYCEHFDNDFLADDDTLIFRPTEDQHAMYVLGLAITSMA